MSITSLLPRSPEAFEKLVTDACAIGKVDVDDNMRILCVQFLHGLDRHIYSFDVNEIGAFLNKMKSNEMTWQIADKIGKERQTAEAARKAEAEKEKQKPAEA